MKSGKSKKKREKDTKEPNRGEKSKANQHMKGLRPLFGRGNRGKGSNRRREEEPNSWEGVAVD